jgi:hypothetical protein
MDRVASSSTSNHTQNTQAVNQPQNNTRNAAANLASPQVRNSITVTEATQAQFINVVHPDNTTQVGKLAPLNLNYQTDMEIQL